MPAEQNIVVKYGLEDSSGDPCDLDILVSDEGVGSLLQEFNLDAECETLDDRRFCRIPVSHIILGNSDRLRPRQEIGFTWDSHATLGPRDFKGAVIAIQPSDGLRTGLVDVGGSE